MCTCVFDMIQYILQNFAGLMDWQSQMGKLFYLCFKRATNWVKWGNIKTNKQKQKQENNNNNDK